MAKSGGTWGPGTNPTRKKGQVSKKTIVKKAIGIDNWNELSGWIETHGIKRYIEELNKLKGANYLYGMSLITDFVKPKLARTVISGEINGQYYSNGVNYDQWLTNMSRPEPDIVR